MSVMSTIFGIYMFLSTLLSASIIMEKEDCFSNADKLYMIDGYANYVANNETYVSFVSLKEQCIFNNTAFYYFSLDNVSNISNGTFKPSFDAYEIQRSAENGGRFK